MLKGMWSLYLIGLSIWDIRTHRNPWWVTTPLLAFLSGQHLYQGTWRKLVLPWTLVTLMYAFHVFGAADWRLLMLTLAVFPNPAYYHTLIYGAFVLLIIEMFRTRQWGKTIVKPTKKILYATGSPAIHVIAIPTLVYLWGTH